MEAQLFEEGTVPEHATPEWYAGRERAPHLEQAAHQVRLYTALEMVLGGCRSLGLHTVVDLGAGDGGLLQLLARSPVRSWGYDLQPSNVEGALQRGVDVQLADVVARDSTLGRGLFRSPIRWGQMAVATEMLEHLVDPHGFLRNLPHQVQAIVASSPMNETATDHYEFHLWAFDVEGYAAMFAGAGWVVLEHRGAGPFQVLLARRPTVIR